jgi:hypothetical protein
MTRKHHHHLTYENQLLKQKVQQLEYEIQELTQTKSSQSNHHTNTLMFLQHKNSELTRALLDKTKDVVKLQTTIHNQKQKPYPTRIGVQLDSESSSSSSEDETRDVKPVTYGPLPSMNIIPQPIVPPPHHPSKPKGLGHRHRWGRHGGHGSHGMYGGWYGYPWFLEEDDDYRLYRDMSGNTQPHAYPHSMPPHPKIKPRSIGHFENPFLSGSYDEREFVVPIKKPTHVIPPAKPRPPQP